MRRFLLSKRIIGFICSCVICVGCEGIGGISDGSKGNPPSMDEDDKHRVGLMLPVGDDDGGVFGFLNTNDPETDTQLNDVFYTRMIVKKVATGDILFQSSTASTDDLSYKTEKHEIHIYGTKVILKRGNDDTGASNNLFETLCNDNNISDLYIYAERVEIYNKLVVPGANVHIFAKSLVFSPINDSGDDFASIVNTPAAHGLFNNAGERPPTWVNLSRDDESNDLNDNLMPNANQWIDFATPIPTVKPSRPGNNAGNIDLNISSIDQGFAGEKARHRFISIGEKGENAANGRTGKHGKDSNVYASYNADTSGLQWSGDTVGIEVERHNITIPAYPNPNPWDTTLSSMKNSATLFLRAYSDNTGTVEYPTNGETAVASGVPGRGGNGGIINSSVSLDIDNADLSGGASGETGSNFSGGRGGYPREAKSAILSLGPQQPENPGYTTPYTCDFQCQWLTDQFKYTTDGAPAAAPPLSSSGSSGSVTKINKQFSYLHPYMVGQSVLKIRDMFLRGYRTQAYEKAQEFISYINSYTLSAEWSQIDKIDQNDFLKHLYDLKQMQQKLEGNLDYFGNPAGWVPMISLEVTMSAYEKEIGDAIQTMYLRYWLTRDFRKASDTRSACITMRDKACAEKTVMLNQLPKAYQDIYTLKGDAQQIDKRLAESNERLRIRTEELAKKAENEAAPKKYKKILRVSAAIMKAIPVYQPALGMAGAPLAMAGIEEDAGDLGSLASTLETYSADAKSLQKITSDYYNDVQNYRGICSVMTNNGVSGNISEPSFGFTSMDKSSGIKNLKGVYSAYKSQGVPASKVEKILHRLIAEDFQYQALLLELKNIMKDKQVKAKEIADKADVLNSLVQGIAQREGIVTSVSAYLSGNTMIGFSNVMGYIDDMDRMARERLLKYHYYMSKAYEYRMLSAYKGNLTVQNIFNTLVRQYEKDNGNNSIGGSQQLNPDQFMSLKSIFKSQISEIVDEMYTHKVNNPPSYGMPVSLKLTDDQIDQLNSTGKILFNPVKAGLFFPTEENLRIANISISFNTDADSGFSGNSGYVELKAVHSGISIIESKGKRYLFKNYSSSTETAKSWATRKDLILGETYTSTPSASETTLLSTILGGSDSDVAYYSLPAAQADISIIKKVQTSNGQAVKVKDIIVKIEYEFEEHKDCSTIKILSSNDSLAPPITLNRSDIMEQKDGYGYFSRSYSRADGSVIVSAPTTYGEWTFDAWVDETGKTYSVSPTVTIELTDVVAIKPIYKNVSNTSTSQ